MTLSGSQLLIQEVGTDGPAWVKCQPLAQISVGSGLGHIVQTRLSGTTTVPIEIGKKGRFPEKVCERGEVEVGQVVGKKNLYMLDKAGITIPLSTDEDTEAQRG